MLWADAQPWELSGAAAGLLLQLCPWLLLLTLLFFLSWTRKAKKPYRNTFQSKAGTLGYLALTAWLLRANTVSSSQQQGHKKHQQFPKVFLLVHAYTSLWERLRSWSDISWRELELILLIPILLRAQAGKAGQQGFCYLHTPNPTGMEYRRILFIYDRSKKKDKMLEEMIQKCWNINEGLK